MDTRNGCPADPGAPPAASFPWAGPATATGPNALSATVRLPMPMDQALRLIPSSVGVHRPDGPEATIVDVGGPDAERLATYLLGLDAPLRVLSPDSVREALLRRARAVIESSEGQES
ncbi:WYL domain-containing protein [Streptomyces sp. NPDC017230]|uniref:WYL domain-containing protein n=1 Tax=unclassified Streptomyces TaxID=2593676 RepID=UPI00379A1434